MLDNEDTEFVVVTNAEQQYSIWPEALPLPAGWSAVGERGSKAACLAYIERVWTDMRPLSLREFLRASGS
jgi:MbtH protein